jgi:hypothetical protein
MPLMVKPDRADSTCLEDNSWVINIQIPGKPVRLHRNEDCREGDCMECVESPLCHSKNTLAYDLLSTLQLAPTLRQNPIKYSATSVL